MSRISEQNQARLAKHSKINGPFKYVVTFTLYNTLRSSSIDVIAIVIESNKKLYLKYINFATRDPTNYVEGVNVSTGIDSSQAQSAKPVWIYGNTIENRTFNVRGFHDADESKNILITGGVPNEFKDVLEKCDQGYLLNPDSMDGPRFKGGYGNNDATMTAPVHLPDNKSWNVHV